MADPAKGLVYNLDTYGLIRRINRVIVEVVKSQSSGVSGTISFDLTRLNSYLKMLDAYRAWVVSQPQIDCPETGPTAFPLPADPSVAEIENESGWDVVQLLQIARDEIKSSQSSRLPSGLIKFDNDRLVSYIGRLASLVNNYMAVIDPVDLPESSPMQPISGAGNVGV
jgi:hypothetical protein